MANHSITVYNKGYQKMPETQETTSSGVSSNISRIKKPTSTKTQFSHKNSRSLRFLNMTSSLNVEGAISMAGGGVGLTMATLNTGKSMLGKGAGLYFDYASASSGEEMRYQNRKNILNFALNPLSKTKSYAWNYMILAPQKIARQNEALEYNRQLTNNVAFSRSMQKGQF